MKYGEWRHETSTGNGAVQVINIAKQIIRNNDKNPIIYVETPFEQSMCLTIPGITFENIKFFENKEVEYDTANWGGYDNPLFDDICMPDVYPFKNTYPSNWNDALKEPDVTLKCPEINNQILSKWTNSIVMTVREAKTHWKRVDGDMCEPNRFVNPKTFHELALHYANKGFKVVRIGSIKETPFPKHENIFDFAMCHNRYFIEDLYLIQNSKLFVSCDSGVWPMAGGMKKKMLLTNVAKKGYTEWLPSMCKVMFKKDGHIDNTFEEIKNEIDQML
jgi:hypothetical protein